MSRKIFSLLYLCITVVLLLATPTNSIRMIRGSTAIKFFRQHKTMTLHKEQMPFTKKHTSNETKRLVSIIDQIMGKPIKAEDLLTTCESLKEDILVFMKMIHEQKEIDLAIIKDKMLGGTGKPQNPMTERNFLSYNSYLRRAKSLYKNVARTQDIIDQKMMKTPVVMADDLRTWNVNLRIAYNEFEEIVNYYQNTMRSNLLPENVQKIKFLILEKAQNGRPGEDKVYIDMLKVLGFETTYVENYGPKRYTFKFSEEKYDLYYTGYLVDGIKEGRGKLLHENGDYFYDGAFKDGQIFGACIKLWHKNLSLFAHLKHIHDLTDNDFFDSLTLMGGVDSKFDSVYINKFAGNAEIYYRNNRLRFKGELKNGVKDCKQGEEYYDNERLRYSGEFRNNSYYGNDVKIYHSHIDIYKPMLRQSTNMLLKGNFDENGLLQGRLTDGVDSRIFLIDPSYEGLAWWVNYRDGEFDTTNLKDSVAGDKI